VPRHSETTLAAIKNAVDIVALVGEYTPVRRMGSRYKALCPFHDDHNPSLDINPDRQSYKCWSCGAGGDVFDFVQNKERVDFPEALRMLADRAGVPLESPPATAGLVERLSKSDLFSVNGWAEEIFAKALADSTEVMAYVQSRGLTSESVARFRLGFAPEERGWLLAQARRKKLGMEALEQAGLISQPPDSPGIWRERFRGRLIFPIHDDRGRTLGFGGRILPETERKLAALGRQVAKYLNSPETLIFHKRTLVYASDLARGAAREAGWVAVVEGYTDVIAAHQVGLGNVVGTLGTSFGEDHLRALKRLADRVVLVFDGDQAGQSAADRAVEFFLASDLDVRVLSLPANLDPCDFLLKEGALAFRALAERAVEPLDYLLTRAVGRFDLGSVHGARAAAEWIVGILSRIPESHHLGLEFSKAKILDKLAQRLRVPQETLNGLLRQMRRGASGQRRNGASLPRAVADPGGGPQPTNAQLAPVAEAAAIRASDLDPTDLEFIRILLNEPTAFTRLIPRIGVSTLRDAPLRAILQSCYDLQADGQSPTYENVMVRLDDPAIRSLVAGLAGASAVSTLDPAPYSERVRPAPWQERLERMLIVLDERERTARRIELKKVLDETDRYADPDAYRAIQLEYQITLTSSRPRKT
jgi:DNA primase